MKYRYLFLLLLIFGCDNIQNYNQYSSPINIKELRKECSECFDEAEKEIIIQPKPDVIPDETNQDPSKCVCKGSGIIVHRDGHKTQCPYHYRSGFQHKK